MEYNFNDEMTLGEAKGLTAEMAQKGGDCPCCGQNVRIYKRPIYKRMATSLVKLAEHNGLNDFVHWSVYDTENGCGDFAKLRYWGLIEEQGISRQDGGSAGFWKITPKGARFLRGDLSVPKHAVVFDKDVLYMDDTETLTIEDALGEPFDLREIMSNTI